MVEVRAREGRVKRRIEEEEYHLVRSFHGTLLLGKLQKAVCQVTDQDRGGCLLLGGVCMNTR